MEPLRILVVENDAVVRDMLGVRLRSAGYMVVGVANTRRALKLLCEQRFALLLADLALGADAILDLLKQARELDAELELLMIGEDSTRDTLEAAMEYGVRGYLQKPVLARVLEQRVAVAVGRNRGRREQQELVQQILMSRPSVSQRLAEQAEEGYAATANAPALHTLGPLQIDLRQRQVRAFGTVIPLSACEFKLLVCLARNVNCIMAPEQLAEEVLGYSCEPHEARDLIKSHIYRIRKKLGRVPFAAKLIVSVRGSGYLLAIPDS